MSRWRITLLLASWEFRRYFKWKSQLISMGIGVVLMVGIALLGPRLVRETIAETMLVGVVGEAPFALAPTLGIEWRRGDASELRAAYEAEEVGALLTLHTDSEGTLESRSEGGWVHSLQNTLDDGRRQSRLGVHGLDPAVLSDVMDSFDLEQIETGPDAEHDAEHDHEAQHEPHKPRRSRWDRIIALTMVGFMFGGLFAGTALLFSGITSEKQQLVTEQIVAAVPPQTWIDGKILGIGFRAITSALEMVLWGLLGMLVWRDFVNPEFVGLSHVSPVLLLGVGLLAVLGFCLWFCFFAAIAATIDDPNTSARGMLMLVPMIAPALAVPVYLHPDSDLSLVLSLLPPTATIALTVRMALTDVAAWQYVVAVVGMGLTVAFLRRAAGKVFAMAILMHGKEPSWREIWRAARRSA